MRKILIAVLITISAFLYADIKRGYHSTGGEIFLVFIPLYLTYREITKRQKKIERQNEYIKVLEKNLYK